MTTGWTPEQFNEIYNDHVGAIHAMLRSLVDATDAEDLTNRNC